MAIEETVIKTLLVEAKESGLGPLAEKWERLTDAQGRAAYANNIVAVAMSKTERGAISAERALTRYRDSFKSSDVRQFERDLKVLETALGQNKLTAEEFGQEVLRATSKLKGYGEEMNRVARIRAAMVNSAIERNTGLGAVPASQAGATTSALADLARRMDAEEAVMTQRLETIGRGAQEAFWKGFNERVGISTVSARDGGATTSALASMIEEAEVVGKASREAYWQAFNERVGIGATAATSAGATTSALAGLIEEGEVVGKGAREAFWNAFNERVGIGRVAATSAGAGFSALKGMIEEAEEAGRDANTAFWQGFNQRMGIGAAPATSMGATFSALEAVAERAEMAGRGAQEAFWRGFNERVGVSRTPATSAGAGFSALAEKDRQEAEATQQLAAAHRELLQQIEPVAQAQERHTQRQALYKQMLDQSIISTDQYQKALALSEQRLRTQSTGVSAYTTGLAGLSYQINDVISGLIMGQSVFMVVTQQGGQIVQLLGDHPGGVAGGAKAAVQQIGELLSRIPVLAGVLGGVAGTATIAALAFGSYKDQVDALNRSLLGLGRMGGQTRETLEAIAGSAASGGRLTRADARSAVQGLNQSGAGFGQDELASAMTMARGYARILGTDLPDAAEKLGAMFRDPIAGAKQLQEQIGFFSPEQMERIRARQLVGDFEGARRALAAAASHLVEANKETSNVQKAWNTIKDYAAAFAENVGKGVSRLAGDEVVGAEERLRRLMAEREKIEKSGTSGFAMNRGFRQQQLDDVNARIAAEQKKQADAEAVARESALRLQRNQIGQAAQDAIKSILQETEALKDLERQIQLMERSEQVSPSLGVAARDAAAARNMADTRAIRMHEELGAGGSEFFQALREANREMQNAGLGSYEASLAAINQKYEDLARSAKEAKDATAALRSVEAARVASIRALDINTAKSAAERVLPDVERRRGIEDQKSAIERIIGDPEALRRAEMTADQAKEALARLTAGLNEFKTSAEQVRIESEFQTRLTLARTADERAAIEAERARSEAVRNMKGELEAAAQAEAARTRVITDATKAARDAIRDARNEERLIGLNPLQRAQEELRQRLERLRENLSGVSPAMDNAIAGLNRLTAAANGVGGAATAGANMTPRPGVAGAVAGSRSGLDTEFARRLKAFSDAIGGISVTSGFRTFAQQAALYAQKPHLAARPGTSNHEFGVAADLRYANDNVRREAHRRAGEFGLRFPMGHEPWHVEPVEARNGAIRRGGRMQNMNLPPRRDGESIGDQAIRETERAGQREIEDRLFLSLIREKEQALDGEIRMLEAQQRTVGMSTAEIARMNAETEISNQLRANGREDLSAYAEGIANIGNKAAEAAEKSRQLAESQKLLEDFKELGKDVLKGFISDLRQGKSLAEALSNVFDKIASKLIDMAINSLFEGLGGGGTGGGGLLGGIFGMLFKHGGGDVHRNVGVMKPVNPLAFIGAPRFHSGTGLAHDEVPAILQTGERVLSRADMRAIDRAGRTPAAANSNVQVTPPAVNVYNNSGSDARVERREDGGIDVIIDAAEQRMASRAAANRGGLARTFKRDANLNRG